VREYKGYIQNGQVISPEAATLPENAEVVVRTTGQILPFKSADEELLPEHKAALKFLDSIKELRKEDFTEEDIEAFEGLERGDYKLKFEVRLP